MAEESEDATAAPPAVGSDIELTDIVIPESPAAPIPSSVLPKALANALLKADASADYCSERLVDQTERRLSSISSKKLSMMLSRTKLKSSPSQLSKASNWIGEVNLLLSRMSTPAAE